MSDDSNRLTQEEVVEIIAETVTETVKDIQDIMQTVKLVAGVTQEVLLTLRECGLIVDRPHAAGDARALSHADQLAHDACKRLLASRQP